MLSKQTIKRLKSLKLKKYRYKEAVFLVEGGKSVEEALSERWPLAGLWATKSYIESSGLSSGELEVVEVSEAELASISALSTNKEVLALAEIPKEKSVPKGLPTYLALKGIRDPGNLGTMIRLADWFGLPSIFCSVDCVDPYHPKVIQASMGSFTRVHVHQGDLLKLIEQSGARPLAASLSGVEPGAEHFEGSCCLVIGSESHGLSEALLSQIDTQLSLPRRGKAESLNAAMAAGMLLDRRFQYLAT